MASACTPPAARGRCTSGDVHPERGVTDLTSHRQTLECQASLTYATSRKPDGLTSVSGEYAIILSQ